MHTGIPPYRVVVRSRGSLVVRLRPDGVAWPTPGDDARDCRAAMRTAERLLEAGADDVELVDAIGEVVWSDARKAV